MSESIKIIAQAVHKADNSKLKSDNEKYLQSFNDNNRENEYQKHINNNGIFMTDYELATCEALVKDFVALGSNEWDIEDVHKFWSEYSYYKNCEWADYLEGDLGVLSDAIDFVYEINFGEEDN